MRYVFLNNEEHPWGRHMLFELLSEGLVPELIVEERSRYAAKKKAAYEACLQPENVPPMISTMAKDFGIRKFTVDNINRAEVLLKEAGPDLIALGNVRIIKPQIICLAPRGCLNIHPGLLPAVRGAFPQAWSLLKDQPFGCTAHFIDSGVDTGPIVLQERIDIYRSDSLQRIVERSCFSAAALMKRCFFRFAAGDFSSTAQPPGDFACYHWPSEIDIAAAKRVLASGAYSHFSDKGRDERAAGND